MIEETVAAYMTANLQLCLAVDYLFEKQWTLQYVIPCTYIPVPVLTEPLFSLDKRYKTNKPSNAIESTQVVTFREGGLRKSIEVVLKLRCEGRDKDKSEISKQGQI